MSPTWPIMQRMPGIWLGSSVNWWWRMHASEILQCRCRSVVTSRSLKNKTFPFCVVTASLVTQCYCKQLLFKHDETTCANFQLGLSRLVLTYSLTNCLRSVRYDWIHDAAVPDTPNSVCSRCSSVWWQTVSKAADRSRPMSTVGCCEDVDCVCVCCSTVTPHSKLHFKVYNRYQLKQDVLMGTGKLDMFVLLRQHSGRCQFNNFMFFFQSVSYYTWSL